jgi:hypothetical protein
MEGHDKGEFTLENPKAVAHAIVTSAQMWPVKRWHLKEYFTFDEYLKQQKLLIMRAIIPQLRM